ncbi:MAG: glycogen debranching protein GlgX [Bacteroidetes bacterium]|nr:glycogen debranching protein GlgX [Bacteroidota bacterium]
MQIEVYPGMPFPLGATWDGHGVNFALYTECATGVTLCLFNDINDDTETLRLNITERSGHIWHAYIPNMKPGQLYAYRVDGPYDPGNGMRFNANKLLLDPNAKAIGGEILLSDATYGYEIGNPQEDLSFSKLDSAAAMPKCIVIDPGFNWEDDINPKIPLHKTIIYELHIKGFTKLHQSIPEQLRGTYAGLAHPESIKYLKDLGITTVELMPVHYFINDRALTEKGLSNYWGYNTIGFFAPASKYSSSGIDGSQVNEFKAMVKELHKAGIEVILDVVFNHTAEGNQMGPTLSFKGIDNAMYYRLADDKRYYNDYTGTGNTLNARLPPVLRLIMDSLRYWIQEMHIDGFRFDLAATLARELHEVDRLSSFFDIIYQDPIISQVKLIAEPWDVGDGGYQVGNFPAGWSEWNGKYRDCMRDFWRGSDSMLGEFAERFTGSSDLYRGDSRRPTASINFITAHDGFTLADLVSYNEKHNEANGENNNDGDSNNRSWNCGAEGPTDNQDIINLRKKQQRNFLTTLFLSQGVPMLVAGDEIGRSQQGNNNAYCQDNEISWINWEKADHELLEFTKMLIHFCKSHPVFCRRGWFQGQKIRASNTEDIAWFKPGGDKMTEDDWTNGFAKSLAVYLNGKGIHSLGPKGEKIVDDSFYLIFNAYEGNIKYKLPDAKYGKNWKKIIDTDNMAGNEAQSFEATNEIDVKSRSIVVLINHE